MKSIEREMGYIIAPIVFNQDGSISANVAFGYLGDSPEQIDTVGEPQIPKPFIQISQQGHHIPADDVREEFNLFSAEKATLKELLDDAIERLLKKRGVLP